MNNDDTSYSDTNDNTELTGGVGTALYIAPEQLKSNNYDQRADMYR